MYPKLTLPVQPVSKTVVSYKQQMTSTVVEKTYFEAILKDIRDGVVKTQILMLRKEDDKKKRNKLKGDLLPQFYCCVYQEHDKGATEANIKRHTGLMAFDVDDYKTDSNVYREKVLKSPYGKCVKAIFESPSGGLKFFIQTTFRGKDKNLYKHVYKSLYKDFVAIGLPEEELDSVTCNINRGTFYSYDPNLYYKNQVCQIDTSDYERDYYEVKADQHRKQQAEAELLKGGINEEYAKRSMNKVFATLSMQMVDGKRDATSYRICCAAFERGFTWFEAAQYLRRCSWTESTSQEEKAKRAYDSWKSGGGSIDIRYMNRTPETTKAYLQKGIESLFAKHMPIGR